MVIMNEFIRAKKLCDRTTQIADRAVTRSPKGNINAQMDLIVHIDNGLKGLVDAEVRVGVDRASFIAVSQATKISLWNVIRKWKWSPYHL